MLQCHRWKYQTHTQDLRELNKCHFKTRAQIKDTNIQEEEKNGEI